MTLMISVLVIIFLIIFFKRIVPYLEKKDKEKRLREEEIAKENRKAELERKYGSLSPKEIILHDEISDDDKIFLLEEIYPDATLYECRTEEDVEYKDEYNKVFGLARKYQNLSPEEIVLTDEIDEDDKEFLLKGIHGYEYEKAVEMINIADKEKEKIRHDKVRRKISKKAQEIYGDIPTDDTRQPISDEVKMFVWNRDGGKCVNCGSKEKIEFDHIIPFSKGGSNTARNIQILCEKCNREKRDSIS